MKQIKIKYLILSILFLVSCAQPKYLQPKAVSSAESISEQSASCELFFSISRLCIQWQWVIRPTATKSGSLVFKVFHLSLYDKSSIEENLKTLPKVVLWMPSMGHGSTPTKTSQIDTGTYKVDDVFFIMAGPWQIKFNFLNEKDEKDEAIVDFVF